MKEKDIGHNPSIGVDSHYTGGASLSFPSLLSSVPPVAPLAFDQGPESGNGLGVFSSSNLYGYGTFPVCNWECCYSYHHNYASFFSLLMSCSTLVLSVCII